MYDKIRSRCERRIAAAQRYLDTVPVAGDGKPGRMYATGMAKAQARIEAFETVLSWIAEEEKGN